MKPGRNKCFTAHTVMAASATVLASAEQAVASPLKQVTLDGLTRADGIRSWIEISEPGNLGLLLMGVVGVLVGRWAASHKRKGPPPEP